MSGVGESGFIPWDDGEEPVLYLNPHSDPIPWTGDLESFKDAYFERYIEVLRTAWFASETARQAPQTAGAKKKLGGIPRTRLLRQARQLCREHQRPLPEWLDDALTKVGSDDRKRRGRQGNASAQERDDDVHHIRWAYMATALQSRRLLPLFGYAATVAGAKAFVSEQLKGTIARGEPDAIHRSYKIVRRTMKLAQQGN